MYRPLPDGLTIKNSPIEGLGLFTSVDIKKEETLTAGIVKKLKKHKTESFLFKPNLKQSS